MSAETRFTPEEALSPQDAFDAAIKNLQELDTNALDITTPAGSKPIHDVFRVLVNIHFFERFRILNDKGDIVGIQSPDRKITIHHSNDGGDSAVSGIEIETISLTQLARGSSQVEKIELRNKDRRYQKFGSENYVSVSVNEVFTPLTLDSTLLGKKVEVGKSPTLRHSEIVNEPAALIQHFVRGLQYAREEFVK